MTATTTTPATDASTVKTVENSSRTYIARALGVKATTPAYFFYLNSRRSAFKEANPKLAPKDVVSGIAAEWRDLSEEERAPYVEQAAENKERFNAELDAAIERHGDGPLPEVQNRQKREKKQKRPTMAKHLGVKGAKTAYILFGQDRRARIVSKNPDASQRDILRLISKEWKKITPTSKKRYEKKAVADRARYNRELQAAIEANPEKVKSLPGRKVRSGPVRVRTAYLFFCKHQRPVVKRSLPNLDVREQTRELGRRWRELSDDDKVPYVKQSEEDKVRYNSELADYSQENTVVTNEPTVNASSKKSKSSSRNRRARRSGSSAGASA